MGRNIARTLLQYYRFINVLHVPMVSEIITKRKVRSKTNLPKSNSKIHFAIPVRPKTTRNYAPISYNDLSICYECISSDEACSPIRQSFVNRTNILPKLPNPDNLSMMSIKSSKFDKLILIEAEQKLRTITNKNDFSGCQNSDLDQEEAYIGTKQYLSIIDFNKLTRSSIEKAVTNSKKS